MQSGEPAWTDVARVTNLAEAGFLTDELVGLGIDARVHRFDDFNALCDRWTSLYLIRVPEQHAEEAASQIRQYTQADDGDRPGEQQPRQLLLSSHLMDPLFWRPIALVVLTGYACFLFGQRLSGQNADRPMNSHSLSSTVGRIGRSFTTEPAANQPRYRLSFDSRRQAWLLDADRDHDGRYDDRQQFHASGAAW
jgi:hypothetical protein